MHVSDWPKVSLGEAATFLDSQRRPVKANDRVAGPYPYYGANGQQGTIDRFIFDEPLVLLAEDGGHFEEPHRGIAYLVQGKTWVNNHAHVLRANDDFIPDFIEWQLKHRDIRAYITGTTRGKLTKSDASRISISKPPVAEQRRIVDILDRAASIRRLRRQAQETVGQIVPALFNKMFGDPLTNSKAWPVASLDAVAHVASGVTKGRRLDGAQVVEVPYMRVANVQDGFLNLNEVKTIPLRPSEFDRFRLLPGDMLMTEGGDPDKLGRGAIWNGQIPYCAHQNHVFRVRADRNRVRPHFLACLAGSPYGKGYFLRVAKRTTGIASINKRQLSAFPVLLPPVPMQEEFERRVDDCMRLSGRQEAAEAACEAAAQAILSSLLSI